MKKMKKYVSAVLAVILACAIFFNDGTIMMAWATGVGPTEGISTGNGDQTPVPTDGTNEPDETPVPTDGTPAPTDGINEPDETPAPTDGINEPDETPAPTDGTDETPVPTEDPAATPAIDPEATATPTSEPVEGEEEHIHTWMRTEGELYPVCSECGEVYYDDDCNEENGLGIHVFEWIEEEGVYRCAVCGYEKEALEEWDLTIEKYMEIAEIAAFSLEFNGETSTLPQSRAELEADKRFYEREVDGKTVYVFDVQNLADLLALQNLNHDSFDFTNCIVQFVGRKYASGSGDRTYWNLKNFSQYNGLGTEDYPFKGTITTYFEDGSLRFYTDRPLLNYVSTEAVVKDFQIDSAIKGNGATDPVGIIAAHVVRTGESEKVSLSDLVLTGSVTNTGGTAGILFGEVTNSDDDPIVLDYGKDDGAKKGIQLNANVTAAYAGGIAGKTVGNVIVYPRNFEVLCTDTRIAGSSAAGMLIGSMEQDGDKGGELCIDGTKEITVTAKVSGVSGTGTSGGLVGEMTGGTVSRIPGDQKLLIGGTISGPTRAGGLLGYSKNTTLDIDQLEVSAAIDSTVASGTAGGVIGQYESSLTGSSDGTFDSINHVAFNGSIRNAFYAGGVIGRVNGSNLRIGSAEAAEDETCVTIGGSIYGQYYYNDTIQSGSSAGGVVGSVQGQYIEVYNVSSNATLASSYSQGRIFGTTETNDDGEKSVVKIKNAVAGGISYIRNGYEPWYNMIGGLIGTVKDNCMVALDGKIDVSQMTVNFCWNGPSSFASFGYIAGCQTQSLIYFENDDAYDSYVRPRFTTVSTTSWVDDIGNYGGVYLNADDGWGEGSPIISYAQKEVLGTVGGDGTKWKIDTPADIIRLAIMLNTEGNFASACFSGKGKTDLLAAEYELVDRVFDLTRSGIYSFNRNDRTNQYFTGKLIGEGNNTAIRLGDCMTYQSNIGLFPSVGSGAVFKNLKVEGQDENKNARARNIIWARHAAGLAIYANGNVTVENVKVNTAITGNRENAARYVYGGMFSNFTAADGGTLSVKNSEIDGSITITASTNNAGNKQYAGGMIAIFDSAQKNSTIEIDGLSLNQNISSSSRYASGMITQIDSSDAKVDRTVLKMSDITIKDGSSLRINDTAWTTGENKSNVSAGGFLGREWFNVTPYKNEASGEYYSIKNLKVGEGGGTVPSYTTNVSFGGMVHKVTGRIQMVDTEIKGLGVTGAGTSNDGLLFNNGYDALIEIDGYTINEGNVKVNNAADFSEIIGKNISSIVGDDAYHRGGVVNIISSDFANNFNAYKNHVIYGTNASGNITEKSNMARYYYNLFGTSLAGEDSFISANQLDGTNIVITSSQQMMFWHLSQYMNDSIRKRYLSACFNNGAMPDRNQDQNITISGTIDLNNTSYYPTPVSKMSINASGATIKFQADKIKAYDGQRPSVEGEHYMMHSGLFLSQSGNVAINNNAGSDFLTLTGVVSNIGSYSGALFSRHIKGNKKIYYIRLNDLYIQDYSGDHVHGLLISEIRDDSDPSKNITDGAMVDISWIETTGYSGGAKKAASALIGKVGRPDSSTTTGATNITILFTNMKVNDKSGADGIFQNATFIDQHYYTDDDEKNNGHVRYLFTKEARNGENGDTSTYKDPFDAETANVIYGANQYASVGSYITIGWELKDGIEDWNIDDVDISTELVTDDGSWSSYLPYVCAMRNNDTHENSKGIEVNPKTRNITKGCGTYEDPYIIENAKQLLALSRYLIRKDDVYLQDWYVNEIGDNSSFCNGTDAEHTLHKHGEDEFPSQDELRQAYYKITGDIDFSGLTYSSDKTIAQQFAGLGTETMPFSGVIVGAEKNGDVPKIILPNKSLTNNTENFGFIMYAKGAVVKNLKIESYQDPGTETGNKLYELQTDGTYKKTLTNVIRVKENAGSVIACVLGGDNIIDNVTVSNKVAVTGPNTTAGGYVGTVRQGSVILRNMTESSLSGFQCGKYESGELEAFGTIETEKDGTTITTYELDNYFYVSGAVGKVENGFVIYDGDKTTADVIVLDHAAKSIKDIYNHATLPISKHYDILTALGLKAAKESPMNIEVGADGNFTCKINTAAQLQIVSMAINSDAFSVYYDGGGYDKDAICRKAKYDSVGNCVDGDTDRTAAITKDDDTYYYPYIYDYFKFAGIAASASTAGNGFYNTLGTYAPTGHGRDEYYSKLNAVTNQVSETMNYELVNNSDYSDETYVDYDLSGYCRAFRGLGATYRVFESDSWNVNLSVRNNDVYSDFRANFDGKGATVNAAMKNDYDKTIHTIALFNDLIDTSAKNSYTIQNLVVTGEFKNSELYEKSTDGSWYSGERAAAVVGMMRRPWTLDKITVINAKVSGYGYVGGVVAWINPGVDQKVPENYELKNLTVKGDTQIKTVGGTGGGILGVMAPVYTNINEVISNSTLSISNCQILGEEAQRVAITNEGVRLTGETISTTPPQVSYANAYRNRERAGRGRTGALVGYIGKRVSNNQYGDADERLNVVSRVNIEVSISDSNVKYTDVSGSESTGGILGEYCGYGDNADVFTIKKTLVENSVITSSGKNESVLSSFGVGGMIGKFGRYARCEITDSDVKASDIKSTSGADNGLSAGGVIGSCFGTNNIKLTNVNVTNEIIAGGGNATAHEISSVYTNVGGLIGRYYMHSSSYLRYGTSNAEIVNCSVTGMKIVSDDREDSDTSKNRRDDIASASRRSGGYAGGMIGNSYHVNVTVSDGLVDECEIRTGKYSVGGILGHIQYNARYKIENVKVTNSKLGYTAPLEYSDNSNEIQENNSGVGGVIGHVHAESNYTTYGTMEKITVEKCDLFGKNTGGLVGYSPQTNVTLGNILNGSNDDGIKITDNHMLGYYVGGVIGRNSSKTCFEDVTVSGNTILAMRDGSTSAAGGFCGYKSVSSDTNVYNQITVTDNKIVSYNTGNEHYAGGMFGYVNMGNYSNYMIYAYETELKNNHIGYYKVEGINNYINSAATNTSGTPATPVNDYLNKMIALAAGINNNDIKLLNTGSNNSEVNSIPTDLAEDNLINYAGYYGNFVGVYDGIGHAYFIKPTVTYDSTSFGNGEIRPVTDVGYKAKVQPGAGNNNLLNSPYDYRKNIHIIYFEPDKDAGSNLAANIWQNEPGMGEKDYLFNQINPESIIEDYENASTSGGTALLDAYRLNYINDAGKSITTVYSQVYKYDQDQYISPLKVNISGTYENLPMIVLDAQYGSADELLSAVMASLTGVGGVLNSGENNNLHYDYGLCNATSISFTQMKVENGRITTVAPADQKKTLNITQENNRKKISFASLYDVAELDANGNATGNGTFTMLTITYGKSGTYSTAHNNLGTTGDPGYSTVSKQYDTVTVQIPVYVTERLMIDTHLKLVEGAVYDVEAAKEKGLCTEPILANDSSYTLYSEFIYSDARKSFSTDDNPIVVDKSISMVKLRAWDQTEMNVTFWKGTIMTLIDVCDSNKVYYYEVTGEETGPIKYTNFWYIDDQGKKQFYKNKQIHEDTGMELHAGADDPFITMDATRIPGTDGTWTYEENEKIYEDVAVERFLIVVDTSRVKTEDMATNAEIVYYRNPPELTGNYDPSRTILTENTDMMLTRQPGLTIQLNDNPEITKAEGNIDADNGLTVEGQFTIEADSEYWKSVTSGDDLFIDSENHGKYLDIDLYLTKEDGTRVPLPSNTNVTMQLAQTVPYGEMLLSGEKLVTPTGRTDVYVYKDGKIKFPLDTLKDIILRGIEENEGKSENKVDISFKVEFNFEQADLTDYVGEDGEPESYVLNLNLVRTEDSEYPAGGKVIDTFRYICAGPKQSDLACALETLDLMQLGINIYDGQAQGEQDIDFMFKLDYNSVLSERNTDINRKIADQYYTVTYRILEKTKVNDGIEYRPYKGDKLKLELAENKSNSDGTIPTLQKGTSSVDNECNSQYITYHFTLDEIVKGTDNGEDTLKGVVTRQLRLKVLNAEEMDLSNYKIVASVVATEKPPGDIDEKVNEVLSDFFIFTIANLKTDLDY